MADASVGQPQGESASEQQYDPAKDPKHKAKSKDPAWKYCYWPDLNKKDVVKCILCGKVVHAGVRRLKQHLVGGYGEVAKCPKTTLAISKEMHEYLKNNEWVDNQKETVREGDDLAWAHVDEATGASNSLRGHNFQRRARFESTYSRRARGTAAATQGQEEGILEEDEHQSGGIENNEEDDEEYMANDDEEIDDFGESPHSSPAQDDHQANAYLDDLDLEDI